MTKDSPIRNRYDGVRHLIKVKPLIMFHVYILLGFIFLAFRLIYPLEIHRHLKWLLAALLLVISQYHLLLITFFGNMFSPELPRWLVMFFGWAFCSFVLMIVMTLVKDFFLLTLFLMRKPIHLMAIHHNYLTLVIALVSILIAGFGVNRATQVPPVKQVNIYLDHWPKQLNGLKVVQLTDMHISALFPRDWVTEVVKKVNDLSPDLILITGDFIDGTVKARSDDIEPLKRLVSKLGIYGVLGNHEYYFDGMAWANQLAKLGITMLNNRHKTVMVNNSSLVIAGVTDESAQQYQLPAPDIAAAVAGIKPSVPIILLKHQPIDATLADKLGGVSLQLSGHTHGGMIVGLNRIAKFANQGFISGLYQVGDMKLYVSNGTALWSGFPIRLGVPPEITEFTLKGKQQ